jgi:hypothetical protein
MRDPANKSLVFATTLLVSVVAWLSAPAHGQVTGGQLVGAWVRTTPADMKGMEFTKDGKVMIYFGGGGEAMTSDYAVLGDGRLDISEQGVVHNFFLPSLSGDQLQLKDPQSGKLAAYRRLKSGETMVAALASADQALNRAMQVRNATVPDFLARQDLVLVATEALTSAPPQQGIVGEDIRPKIPTPAALQFVPNGTEYGGRAYFDTKPPRLDAVGAQIQNAQADTPTVAVWFGPGNAQQNRGMLLFHPAGTAPNITLTYSIVTGGPPALIIKSDPALHAQILDHIKAEATRLNNLKTPVLAMLKDYVVLKGISGSMRPNERFDDQFVLSRSNNNWIGQLRSTNHTTGATEILPVMATVGIAGQKPAMQILSQKRGYLFTDIDTAGGKLTGKWQMPNNPQGYGAEAVVTQALDAKARDQLFATRKAEIQKLGSGTVYRGLIPDIPGDMPSPIAVTLAPGANGAITGTADYLVQGCTMSLSGKVTDTPFGPQIQLQYTGGKPQQGAWGDAANIITALQHEVWVIGPSGDASGPMALDGFAIPRPGPNAPSVTLRLTPSSDKDKATVMAALTSGAKFKVTNPGGPGPDDIFTSSADPSGKITLTLSAGGTHINAYPGTNTSADLQDASGWYVIDGPAARPGFGAPIWAYKVFLTVVDGQVYLNGFIYNLKQGTASGSPRGRWDAVQVKQ